MSASTLERTVTGLIGGAFFLRLFDDTKPWWARCGYGLVGADLLWNAWESRSIFSGGQRSGLASGLSKGPLTFNEKRVRTIDERVALVHEQMLKGTRDPVVYGLAREVLSRKCGDKFCIAPKDNAAEIEALFFEVKKKVRYTWDPLDYDAFQNPAKTLALKTADCDDMVSLLGAMLRSVGYKVRSRVVRTTGNSSWNHIYLLVQVPGSQEWMPLDTTVDQPPGWEVPKQYVQEVKDFDVVEAGGAPARPLLQATATVAQLSPQPGSPF